MERRPKNPLANAPTRTVSSGVRPTEGLLSEPSSPSTEPSGTHADYDLGAEISRGGMGRIVEAYDRRHDRQVALKLLLHRSESAVLRFRREAWITGRLQHPAIVPLYEAGSLSTGEPFFAMKLVRGSSLADVIANTKTPAERLALLPHLIAAAEAIACAHGEGIIHRDLKPANILVGPYGETVVIDWGLAKRFDESSDDATQGTESFADAAGGLTADGRVVGTPSYMAPEQAHGEPLDARTDVYALGATIFHALSGERPSRGDTNEPLIARAPHVPADLGTIVDKAMAPRAADRYASAMELADDLRRFSSGRLVAAHSYSMRELVRRWVGTHRAVVALGIASVIALVATGAFSLRRITRERDRAEVARAEASERGRSATVQRDAAEKLIGALVGDLRNQLVPLGRLDVMASLGERLLDYYRNAAQANAGVDPGTLLRRAAVIETVAGVYYLQHDFDRAVGAYKEAIRLCDEAHELDYSSSEAQLKKSRYEYRLGTTEWKRSHFAEALHSLEGSFSTIDQIHPNDEAIAADLDVRRVQSMNTKAVLLRDLGELENARDTARDAASRLLDRGARAGANEEARVALGWSFFYAAGIEYQLGDDSSALRDANRSLEIRMRNESLAPDDQYRKLEAAWSHARVGAIHAMAGRDDLAKTEIGSAIDRFAKLVIRDPSQAQFYDARAEAWQQMCCIETAEGDRASADKSCRAALADYQQNAKLAPDETSRDAVSYSLAIQAESLLRAGSVDRAAVLSRQALEGNREVDPTSANATLHDESRAAAHLALARAELADPALHDAAATDALTAVNEWNALLRASPKNVIRATQVVVADLALADARIATRDAAGADASFEAAAATCAAVDPNADVVDLRLACAEVDAKRAARASDATQAAALRDHARALVATIPPSRIRPIAAARWLRDVAR